MREAMLYETMGTKKVRCNLCAHRCTIGPSKRGICGVRENRDGTLYTLAYGTIIAQNVDPIEKKPLFHVYPGSKSFSIATVGCNFRCTFCQNNEISQMPRESGRIMGSPALPEDVVSRALTSGSKTIAYTYTEPTIFFEYALDIGKSAHAKGIRNVFVTNGYMSAEALNVISPFLDAANVDLKSFSDDFYKKYCGARLQPVLDSLKRMKEQGIWLEITTLIIPSLNDSDEELKDIARFIASLGSDTPWHISRFHPHYEMTHLPSTPVKTLHKAARFGAEAGLKYVYTGNVPGDRQESTFCSNCGNKLIDRYGFHINELNLDGSKCPRCGTPLHGILG
ncbi:MAG: AmmeMemoRadiSam system radical SAM enzyme [Deltaproteobacteria bacterium]|nr:AmmeMemoRadiSam system radical SAM enzyme [Deltaproteobacteria bacterium]